MNAKLILNRMSIAIIAAASLIIGLPGPASASATTYYVDNSGACSDSNPGTSSQPWCTIGKAATTMVAGDTTLVHGTFTAAGTNPTNSGTALAPITFQANTAVGGATFNGGTSAFALSSRSYITITGFTVGVDATHHTSGYGISVVGGSGTVISGNTVAYAGTPAQSLTKPGIYVSGLNGGSITGNITHDNSDHGISIVGSSTGVTASGNTSYHNANQWQRNANGINVTGPGNTILNNITHDNEDSGINVYTGANNTLVATNVTYNNGDHGIDDLNVTGGRIIGNTVYRNCTSGINVEGTSGSYLVENNVAVDNAVFVVNPTPIGAYGSNNCNRRHGNIGVWDSAPATTTANFNEVWLTVAGSEYYWNGTAYNTLSSLQTATSQEARGLFANPNFANAAAWDLRLTEGSPAIDSADSSVSGEQTADLLGRVRTDDLNVANTGTGTRLYDDRGAYEF